MQHTELQEIQKSIRFDAPSMARSIGINYETYRNMYYGKRSIPDHIAKSARDLQRTEHAWMTGFVERLNAKVAKDFPLGIMPEGADNA